MAKGKYPRLVRELKTNIGKTTLGIDPGIRTLGACLFRSERIITSFAHTSKRRSDYPRRDMIAENIEKMVEWLHEHPRWTDKIDRVFCEMPQSYGGAVGVAASGQQDVVWLAYCVGYVARWAEEIEAEFLEIPVQNWKGNMPKILTAERIARRLKKIDINAYADLSGNISHDWDAAGVAMHGMGLEL